jgi:hypothetical protein
MIHLLAFRKVAVFTAPHNELKILQSFFVAADACLCTYGREKLKLDVTAKAQAILRQK